MKQTLVKITNIRVIGFFKKIRYIFKVNYLHRYVMFSLFVFSLPLLCSAQVEYIKATEQKARLNFNIEKLDIEYIIASLNEDYSKKDLISNESQKAYLELQKFKEIYPDRYFSEIGPEKIIHVQQIEADFRTKHRNEIYNWEKIKRLSNKFNDITIQFEEVSNAIQTKSDIIPNIIYITKSDADFWRNESSCMTNLIKIRAQLTSSDISQKSFKAVNSNSMKEYEDIIRSFDTAIENFIKISYEYPILQNNDKFKNLKSQLIQNKSKIVTEQKKYNEMIRSYKVLTDELKPEYNFTIKPLFSIN